MKITDAFIAEHAVLYAQLDHLERAIPAAKTVGEIKAMAAMLHAALQSHSDLEDDLLFDGLKSGLDQIGKLEKVQHEHGAICHELQKVAAARTRAAAQRGLLAVVHLTRQEFDLEDRVIFKMAEEHLHAASLTRLGKAWARRRMVPSA